MRGGLAVSGEEHRTSPGMRLCAQVVSVRLSVKAGPQFSPDRSSSAFCIPGTPAARERGQSLPALSRGTACVLSMDGIEQGLEGSVVPGVRENLRVVRQDLVPQAERWHTGEGRGAGGRQVNGTG